MDFQYLAQAPIVDEDGRLTIEAALAEFHEYKECITTARAHRGEKGHIIKHWQIPKLELLQSVTPSIQKVGAVIQ
jgi:hypothetical protein